MASRGGLKGQRVVDVGSGTGAVAIASAIMGAKSAVATDQAQILHLARENIDSFVSSIAGQAERDTRKQQLQIAELDWGDMEQSRAAGRVRGVGGTGGAPGSVGRARNRRRQGGEGSSRH